MILRIPDEGYFRNTSLELNKISTFLFECINFNIFY